MSTGFSENKPFTKVVAEAFEHVSRNDDIGPGGEIIPGTWRRAVAPSLLGESVPALSFPHVSPEVEQYAANAISLISDLHDPSNRKIDFLQRIRAYRKCSRLELFFRSVDDIKKELTTRIIDEYIELTRVENAGFAYDLNGPVVSVSTSATEGGRERQPSFAFLRRFTERLASKPESQRENESLINFLLRIAKESPRSRNTQLKLRGHNDSLAFAAPHLARGKIISQLSNPRTIEILNAYIPRIYDPSQQKYVTDGKEFLELYRHCPELAAYFTDITYAMPTRVEVKRNAVDITVAFKSKDPRAGSDTDLPPLFFKIDTNTNSTSITFYPSAEKNENEKSGVDIAAALVAPDRSTPPPPVVAAKATEQMVEAAGKPRSEGNHNPMPEMPGVGLPPVKQPVVSSSLQRAPITRPLDIAGHNGVVKHDSTDRRLDSLRRMPPSDALSHAVAKIDEANQLLDELRRGVLKTDPESTHNDYFSLRNGKASKSVQ